MKVYHYLNNRLAIHEEGKYPLILSESDTENLIQFILEIFKNRNLEVKSE